MNANRHNVDVLRNQIHETSDFLDVRLSIQQMYRLRFHINQCKRTAVLCDTYNTAKISHHGPWV